MRFSTNPYQKYWWHEDQVATLKQMAKDGASLGEICKAFPNRKMENIILMARHISALNNNKVSEKNKALRDNQKNNFTDIYAERGRKWTDMDDQRLMTMFFQLYSEDEISEQLSRSITAVQKRIMELHPSNSDKARLFEKIRPYIGLKATGKKTVVVKKRTSCNVVSDDALEMVEGIENLAPLSVSEESRNGQRWTQEESEMVADLFNQGYKPTEIARHVGRTERAILAKLGSLGIIDYEYNRDSEQS